MTKMYKRVCLFGVLILVMAFTGCTVSTDSDDVSHENTNIGKAKIKKMPVDNIKIEDLEWNIEEGILRNDRYELFSYTNNSNYVIKNFTINLLQNDSITEDDVAEIHEYMKEVFNWTDEDIKLLTSEKYGVQARAEGVLYPGHSMENQHVFYYKGIIYVKDPKHVELVEPDIATIEYIKDDKIYIEYYDFKTGKYSLDSEIKDAYQWPEYEIMTKIPKPDVLILEDNYSKDDYINFEAFDVSVDEFKEYINQCKEYGFAEDVSDYEDYYTAKDTEGFEVRISYSEDSGSMSVVLDAP